MAKLDDLGFEDDPVPGCANHSADFRERLDAYLDGVLSDAKDKKKEDAGKASSSDQAE